MSANTPLTEEDHSSRKSKYSKLLKIFESIFTYIKRNKKIFLPICLIIISICLVEKGLSCIRSAYDDAEQNTYNKFYQTAFDIAEKQNHVSNNITINVGDAREVSRLEVLRVSDTEFVIKNTDGKQGITSWLEVQGIGVFTTDLSAGEFIQDSARQYVLVKIPKPVLTECTVSGIGKQFWRDSRWFNNGSIAEGVRLSQDQLSEGRLKLEDSMRQSRRFYEAAQKSAVSTIESLVKQWNPALPDLQVEVEFY